MGILSRDFWQNRRIALTGHTGFKGSWLAVWLNELGAVVHGYGLPPQAGPNPFEALRPSLQSTLADIRDRERIGCWLREVRPEVIFHLAAQPLVCAGYDDPLTTFDTNVTGTLNVLDAARSIESLRAVIVVTSDKAYAPSDRGRSLDESAQLGGFEPYSASKACAEIVAQAYAHAYSTRAIIATARAGNVIGGGDWSRARLIPDLVRAIAAGDAPVLRYPDAIRPWQHVLDPLAGYLMLAQRAAGGDLSVAGAWNFGPAAQSEIRVETVVERALRAAGSDLAWRREPAKHAELPALRIDSSKANALLNWHPRLSIDDAIAETMAWYTCLRRGGDVAALSREQIARYERRPAAPTFGATPSDLLQEGANAITNLKDVALI